ncbi:MAG: hypothetical protein QM744_14410 [Mesorhizobium sp.]
MTLKSDPLAYPPRGLSREEAARYIGVGTTKFDELVKAHRLPNGKRVDGRVLWDRVALDRAFSEFPDDEENKPKSEIEKLLEESRR